MTKDIRHPAVIVSAIQTVAERGLNAERNDIAIPTWQRILELCAELDNSIMIQQLEASLEKLRAQ